MAKETTKTTRSKQNIHSLLPLVMADIHAVPKDQRNRHQGFMFRGIDDVYPVLRRALVAHGCSIVPYAESVEVDRQEITVNGKKQSWCKVIVLMKYTIYAPDGSHVVARFYGEGNDTSDKAIAKAHSNAYKKFAFDTFCIPTGEPDPDHDDIPNPPAQNPQETPGDHKPGPMDPADLKSKQQILSWVKLRRSALGFTSGTAEKVIQIIAQQVLGKRCDTIGELEKLEAALKSGAFSLDTGELIPMEDVAAELLAEEDD